MNLSLDETVLLNFKVHINCPSWLAIKCFKKFYIRNGLFYFYFLIGGTVFFNFNVSSTLFYLFVRVKWEMEQWHKRESNPVKRRPHSSLLHFPSLLIETNQIQLPHYQLVLVNRHINIQYFFIFFVMSYPILLTTIPCIINPSQTSNFLDLTVWDSKMVTCSTWLCYIGFGMAT